MCENGKERRRIEEAPEGEPEVSLRGECKL